MYGAILGDIIGSRFEFDRGGWTKDFDLLTAEDKWTDDTVMTVAVAEALMNAGKDASVETIETECVKAMQKWGQRYPYAGYGGKFICWVGSKNPKPYGSYGNGSAMRVSAAGWLYDSIERTREVARATANVSHNHPEGLKGAECTAAVMYLSRTGASKKEIADYVVKEFGYDFSETLEEMRARHEHVETCQDSLPKALRSFIDGESYEDVVRNAVSLGGDTDTLAAIAGAMAEMRRYIVPKDYPGVDIALMHIYLIEGRDRLLANMSSKTSAGCLQVLKEKGVEVLLGISVTDYRDNQVYCSDGRVIRTANLIWTSGVKSEVIKGIENSQKEHRGRILTDNYNRIKGFENIFAIGDVAFVDDPLYPAGYPQLARVAISQGQRLAANLIALANVPIGVLATVGRNRAFVEWGKLYLEGFWAWMVWSVIHILFLIGVQSKIKVFTGWIWNYFGKDLPVRLIIGDTPPYDLNKIKETDTNNISASL